MACRILATTLALGFAAAAFGAGPSDRALAARCLFVDDRGEPMAVAPEGMPLAPSPEALAESFRRSGKETLLLHFHGGLVDAEAGLDQARFLGDRVFGRFPDAFPVSFVWNSGWGDAVDSLRSREPLFANMFSPGNRPNEVRWPYFEAIRLTRHFVADRQREGRTPEDMEAELRAFYRRNVRGLEEEDIRVLAAGMKRWTAEAIAWKRPNSLATPGNPDPEAFGMQYGFLAKSGWDEMKRYIAESCDLSRGAANRLIQALRPAPPRRIVMVAHSAGAIYAMRFLMRAAPFLPATRFEIVLMEPAITYRDMAEAVTSAGAHVDRFRMFAMDDVRARQDFLFHGFGVFAAADRRFARGRFARLYPGSLLYMVSNMLEGEPDTPILGMERFHLASIPNEKSARDDRATVDAFVDWDRQVAWSHGVDERPDPRPGFKTRAYAHSGIWADPTTVESLATTLKEWGLGRGGS